MLLKVLALFAALSFAGANSLRLSLRRRPTTAHQNITLKDRVSHYITVVELGTPPQKFEVVVDTGSSQAWVTGEKCRIQRLGCKCPARAYRTQLSRTSKRLNTPFEIQYAKGAVAGKWQSDQFSLGDHTIDLPNFKFGVADQVSADVFEIEGLIGLSWGVADPYPSLIEVLHQKRLFDPPQFTIWLGKESEGGGAIVFGSGHEDSCGPTLVTVPLLPDDTGHWRFELTSVGFNGTKVHKQRAVTDTGSTIIFVPIREYVHLFGDLYLDHSEPFPCNYPPAQPTLDIQIGSHVFHFDTESLTLELMPGVCMWGFMPQDIGRIGWLLGDTFIRRLCQIHNYGDRTMGFALASHGKETAEETTVGFTETTTEFSTQSSTDFFTEVSTDYSTASSTDIPIESSSDYSTEAATDFPVESSSDGYPAESSTDFPIESTTDFRAESTIDPFEFITSTEAEATTDLFGRTADK